jgi:hypothetical protein
MAQIREGIRGKALRQKCNKMRTVLVRGENKVLKISCNVCAVHCNIIVQYKPTKCTFPKLIFLIFLCVSFTCIETEGSASGIRLYIQLWYGTFYMCQYKQCLY